MLRRYKLQKPTLDDIVVMISDCGYDIIDFDLSDNTSSSGVLIDRLGLYPLLTTHPALTFRKGDLQLVFVNSALDSADKLYTLSHELGHIACGHMHSRNAGEYTIQEEYEANEFSHYLLNPGKLNGLGILLRKYLFRWLLFLLLLAAIFLCASVLRNTLFPPSRSRVLPVKEYYVTDDGNRYHEKDCMTIRNNETVHLMTEEELSSGRYTPCQVCLP